MDIFALFHPYNLSQKHFAKQSFGELNPKRLKGHRFSYHQADKVNAESICDFLWKLRKDNPGKFYVHVIWDNAKPHRDDEVYAFAKELGIKLHYMRIKS